MDPEPHAHKAEGKGLQRFAWLVFSLIVLLIFFGGHVKSTNSGLSVPDWPNTYGHFMFSFPLDRMIGGIFWEHSHRMIASVVGILTFALTVWVYVVEKRKWVRSLSLAASIAVLVQGVFGGLTVLFYLPVWTSSIHGTLAQSYLCMVLILALALSPVWKNNPARYADDKRKPLRSLTLWTVGAIFVQLMLGAVMRHSEAGLAIPDFPTMFGSWVPPVGADALAYANSELARNGILSRMRLTEVTQMQILVHLAHRLWAVAVTVLVIMTSVRVFRHYSRVRRLRRPAVLLLALLTIQVTLGILTIYTEKQPSITTLHVLTGALTLASAVALAAQARHLLYRPEPKSESYPAFAGVVPATSEPEKVAA